MEVNFAKEYLPPQIPVLSKTPSAIEFLNDYVNTNSPFIVKLQEGDISHYSRALEMWPKDCYIWRKMFNDKITVAVTPYGRADCVDDGVFMLPEERKMASFSFFYALEEVSKYPFEVFYLQKQNNNLIEEFGPLVEDVSTDVPWATEAFGCPPDAVNIWIGNSKSLTSLHKDHYENLYFVICGVKKFLLYPPVSMAWMPYQEYQKFQWRFDSGKFWRKRDLKEKISWIPLGHEPETIPKRHMKANTKSYTVEINAGEMLYIPAMWFHEVSQSDGCIALNYWYDMKYDLKYPFFNLLDTLTNLPVSRKDAAVDTQTELESDFADGLHL